MSTATTPVNKVGREDLLTLLRNNYMNTSIKSNESDVMEMDSPIRNPERIQKIIRKLFHSPIPSESSKELQDKTKISTTQERTRKRKINDLQNSDAKIKIVYMKERDNDSADVCVAKKRILVSLFRDKEYSMEID